MEMAIRQSKHNASMTLRPNASRTGAERGFTLIEVLVALAVFAVIALTVQGRSGDVIRQSDRIEQRTFATWIARNALTELQLEVGSSNDAGGPGSLQQRLRYAGREWYLERNVRNTGSAGLYAVELRVWPGDGPSAEDPIARLDSHVSAP